MTTLRTYFDCVQYFKGKVEKQGFRFDFIDNPYTGNHFVVINGCRAKVAGCGAATPVRDMYQAIKDACNEAWKKATHEEMNTSKIFADVFSERTTGKKAIFTVNNLTLDAVKVVLKGIQIDFDTDGAKADFENGFLRKQINSGFHGGNDGFIPTAKGYRRILSELS